MRQETSLRTFMSEVIPTLSERHQEVLMAFQNDDFTNKELSVHLGWDINRVTPRVNELVKMGIIAERERRQCHHTGRTAIVWGINRDRKVNEY
jgi:predicted transcriptional regulator